MTRKEELYQKIVYWMYSLGPYTAESIIDRILMSMGYDKSYKRPELIDFLMRRNWKRCSKEFKKFAIPTIG